jgi:hypothetical protein
MREIEFRGKRRDTGEWVYGGIQFFLENVFIYFDNGQGAYESRMVNPDTVGQYTGLKDNNGVKIFEGDFVDFGPGEKGKDHCRYSPVTYINGAFRCGFGSPISDFVYDPGIVELEAAGNIHDNPELIERMARRRGSRI